MLRYLTAGESHGQALTVIIEGMVAGVPLLHAHIDEQLRRRQQGHGRGGRMLIEKDEVTILAGVRHGQTLGSPIALLVQNRDWRNWSRVMSPAPLAAGEEETAAAPADNKGMGRHRAVTRVRPGHADLSGALKYNRDDARDILERASARETTMRVAAGAVARQLLAQFGVQVTGHVVRIGDVAASPVTASVADVAEAAEASPVRCADPEASAAMVAAIDAAKAARDSLGGIVEVIATGLPPGLGSHVQFDRKLDGRLAQALMSMQAVKGVEIGNGFASASQPGSAVHDEIFWAAETGFRRETNWAGGLEGGMTNGEPLVIRAALKPIATLYKPLRTVDMKTKEPVQASVERSDTCAVPAGAVIAENIVAFVLAQAWLEKFGGDSLGEVRRNYEGYVQQVASF